MTNVKVEVTNKSGGVTVLLLDEEDERIGYFNTLVKRDELESVKVLKLTEKRSALTPSDA
jgi:hypothetical protein